ncbi:1582_t:CDS:2, partial [Funneliformis caledonium]
SSGDTKFLEGGDVPNSVSGCKVDPRTKESHMKERELSIRKSSNVVVEKDIDQINASDNSMDIDIGGFDNDSSSRQHIDLNAPETGYKDKDFDAHNMDINEGFLWIVYWIFKFQERNQLSDTATNALIKFIRYVLISIDAISYSEFPTSLYKACKLFIIKDQIIKYATCKKCYKLYAVRDLPTDRPYRCTFQDYPNHLTVNLRSNCNNIITKQVSTNEGSLHSSNQHLELELLKIVQRYTLLNELSTHANDNQHLLEYLPYIAFKETVGSLAVNDDFDLKEYFEFLSMSKNVKENVGVGSETFLRELIKPMKKVALPPKVLDLLVKYYQNAYGCSFVELSNIHNSSLESIIVLPKVDYFGRLQIGAEVISSTFVARHVQS